METGARRQSRIKNHSEEGKKKIVYYMDECQDEFSRAQITPRVIDGNFSYFHGGVWDFFSFLIQNVFSMPVKLLYAKMKFRIQYIGREKLKLCKEKGYFIYANHTQPFGDTLIPSLANYPKRNFFIVSPENVSMPGLGSIVVLLGAIPIPCDFRGMKHFLKSIEQMIQKNHSVTIYPEAHIWPYATQIRPFGAVSFRYPVMLSSPVYALTNTYHRRGWLREKVKMITYIDGPFYPNETLRPRERQQDLRDRVYECMQKRSMENSFSFVEYRKAD